MADLSQLSDEQLSVYRDLLAKKAAPSAEEPQSYLGKLASNIPSSAANAVSSTMSAYRGGGGLNQPDTLPPMAPGEDPNAPFYGFRQVGKTISDAYDKIRHPLTTLQQDPIGTIATVGQAVSAARGGIGKTTIPQPGDIADSVMSRVPQGFNIVHPDVRAGAGKMALGYGLTEAVPGPMKWPVRTMTMYPGVRQAYRGIVHPEEYAQEAIKGLPTATAPEAIKPPAIFGDPEGFAKLPPAVQDAIRKGTAGEAAPAPVSAPAKGLLPRGPEHYGITPTEAPPAAAPVVAPVAPVAPATVDLGAALNRLKAEQGIPADQHAGETPGAHYPERWSGMDSPTIRSTAAKSKYTRVPAEELGVHGGVENTPIKGPLNTPEKIRIAKELAEEIKKNSKGGK